MKIHVAALKGCRQWTGNKHSSTSGLKQKLVMPSSDCDWKMLDNYLKVYRLYHLSLCSRLCNKYRVIVDGIYNCIAQCFGNVINHQNFRNSKGMELRRDYLKFEG